ncbi:MAG: SDR family oxidoreductase [Deltaproteobacteria bacterium]|nr:SDR family oxidoreductase [Deltaproteobacteria bacterium]
MTRADDTPIADYANMLRLDGRRYVVIGAGQGMGRQTAHALVQNGARIVCVDIERERAEDIAKECGNDSIAWTGDATDRASVARLFQDVGDAFGGKLDGIIDIVGIARYATLLELDDALWDWHFAMNLRHAWLAIQHATPLLEANGGGTMTFVASASGITSAPRHGAYGAAKAGLMSLVRTASVELGPKGIRVNAIAPGVVWTPRIGALLGEEGRARNAANAPLRRVAQPSNIASTLLFLASDMAAYVSGQFLSVDGAVGAKFPFPMGEI